MNKKYPNGKTIAGAGIARRFFLGATCAFVVLVVRMSEAAVYSVAFVVWMSVLFPLLP